MRKPFVTNIRDGYVNPERFWAKVDQSKSGGCWPWTGKQVVRQYGRTLVKVTSARGIAWRWEIASRISYELTYRDLRPSDNVLHSCDNPICVRPDHLSKGTQQDNADGMMARGRQPHLAKLTPAAVKDIRNRYATDPNLTILMLATEYGVNYQTIWKIVRGFIWKRIGGPTEPRNKRWGDRPSREPWVLEPEKRRRFFKNPGKPRGAKLSEIQVREIRNTKGVTLADLAQRFGVDPRTISAIRSKETWEYLV